MVFNIKNLIHLVLFSVCLTACRYEEGPKFTLRKAKPRLVNTWYLYEVYEGAMEKTDEYQTYYPDYELRINENNTYSIAYRPGSLSDFKEKGNWSFTKFKLNVSFQSDSNPDSSNIWRIVRLKEKQMWMRRYIDGVEVEFHLEN